MKLWGQNCHQDSSVGTQAPGLAQMGRHPVWSLDAGQLGGEAQLGSASRAPVQILHFMRPGKSKAAYAQGYSLEELGKQALA